MGVYKKSCRKKPFSVNYLHSSTYRSTQSPTKKCEYSLIFVVENSKNPTRILTLKVPAKTTIFKKKTFAQPHD